MDLMKIGLYGLAGFGAYAAFNHFTKKNGNGTATTADDATASFTGTNWQRSGYGGTNWQNQNLNFAGTSWQRSGANETTNWQEGNVLNASGKRRTPVHPPLYMARNKAMTPIHPPLYESRKRMTPVHPPLYMARGGQRASAANNWLAAIPGRRADNEVPNSYYRGRRFSGANGETWLQGTDWQTTNMSNACGSCG